VYDESGATRDVEQNHLLQVVALLAMEPPRELSPRALHDEQSNVFRAIAPIEADDEFVVSSPDTTMKTVSRQIPKWRPMQRFACILIPGAGQTCPS
jgi:glucose-6-phosphate 1-dehydrogenase